MGKNSGRRRKALVRSRSRVAFFRTRVTAPMPVSEPHVLAAFDAPFTARYGVVVGVDEAGRGCLAGPVVAAAVVLPAGAALPGVDDSKKLSAARREEAFARITAAALAIGVGACSPDEVDRLNVLHAAMEAMRRAVAALAHPVTGAALVPNLLLIDGNRAFPEPPCLAITVVGGDARSLSIAAASIVAKVTRDRLMRALADDFPAYGWAQNAGYPTAAHYAALAAHGPTAHHRRTFRLG